MTRALAAGTDILAGEIRVRLRDDVPAGHKVALRDIPAGGQVRKYGQVIGVATGPIAAGDHVHTHNLAFADFERDYAFGLDAKGHPGAPAGPPATFNGIVRADGQIATRNYLGILTSVNCSATVARMIAGQFQEGSELMAAFPHLDGVVALTHGSGCGMAGSLDEAGAGCIAYVHQSESRVPPDHRLPALCDALYIAFAFQDAAHPGGNDACARLE